MSEHEQHHPMTAPRGASGLCTAAALPRTCTYTSLWARLDLKLLTTAAEEARKDGAPGIDGIDGNEYMKTASDRLPRLLMELQDGSYRPRPVRRIWIPKGNGELRPLGIPTFEDKVVQWAVVIMLEPFLETEFLHTSTGFRPGVGTLTACRRIKEVLLDYKSVWILDADIRGFFDSIDHAKLMGMLKSRGTPKLLRGLIHKFLKAGFVEKNQWKRTTRGTPQGGVISPLLSNLFLHVVLDRWFVVEVVPTLTGRAELVRYADDFVILVDHEDDARLIHRLVAKRLKDNSLELHDGKTRLLHQPSDNHPVTQAGNTAQTDNQLQFLGFSFELQPSSVSHSPYKVVTTTSDNSIHKTAAKWLCCLREAKEGHPDVFYTQDKIRKSVGGYLLYQSRLSNQEGLLRYLDTVRPILIKLLRKAKATSSQLDALNNMLSPDNIPVLIEEARERGRWHRERKNGRGEWRNYLAGNQ